MSGGKTTARLRTERDLGNGKERVQVYEVGRYLVIIRGDRKSTGKHLYVDIRFNDDFILGKSYLPSLVPDCFDYDGNPCDQDIRVQTTSYGTLSPEQIDCFMKDMQEGVDTAKYIGETFIKAMVEGKWNWEVAV